MGGLVEQLAALLLGFFASALPRRTKTTRGLDPTTPALTHTLNGLAELGVASSILVVGFIRFAAEIHDETGGSLGATSSLPGARDLGVWLLLMLSYAIKPTSLFVSAFAIDGLVRGIDAYVNEGRRGLWLLELLDWVTRTMRGRAAGKAMDTRLGPPRPDELVPPARSESGLLELYTVEDKAFFELQVVRVDGALYIIEDRGIRPRGQHEALYYGFRPLRPGEVIRGEVIDLG